MDRFIESWEKLLDAGGIKKDIVFLVVSGIALLFSLLGIPASFDLAWVAIILCGIPIVSEAIIGLITAFDIKADVLVSLALIASLVIGEIFAAGEVAFIMQIGGLLEELTVAKAREGIENLVHLTPQVARIITSDGEKIVPAEQVAVGDIIRVLPGETVAVDGVIISGKTSINQAVMTGESLPVDKSEGDEVFSGTINQYGAFDMKAVKVGEDSSVQRMIKLVQSVDADKAKIVGTADRWATWIVVISLSLALLTWFVTGEIIRGVTILVVFCPCALVLATPTAIMAAIGNVTKHGFLVKEGDALERLSTVTRIIFDKTGTLTRGTPVVIFRKSILDYISDDELYMYCASAESHSEHPLGKAIVKSYKENIGLSLLDCCEFVMIPGRGVNAVVNGKKVIAGNREMFRENGIKIDDSTITEVAKYLDRGCTVTYISIDTVFAGYVVLSDTVREDSAAMISELKELGIAPVLLTGDNENAAGFMAEQVGILEFCADCMPEDKLNQIAVYQDAGQIVCMIGDGINDAPALKKANVSVAMGGIGSDIAMDAADIVLVDDEVGEIPHLLAISKRMMTTIKINITFSMMLNFIAVALAMIGMLGPVAGALVHNCGSVIVVINSARLLWWKYKE